MSNIQGNSFSDYDEKKLIVARYFIKEKNAGRKFEGKDIFYMWNNYFPKDFRLGKKQKFKIKKVKGKNHSKFVLSCDKPEVGKKIIRNYQNKWENIYKWIEKYIQNHTLESCDNDIVGLRNKNYKKLIHIYKPLSFYVTYNKNKKVSDSTLTQYIIKSKDNNRNGSYSSLVDYAENYKQIKGEK